MRRAVLSASVLAALAAAATAAAKTPTVNVQVDAADGRTTVRLLEPTGARRVVAETSLAGRFDLAKVARDGARSGATPDGQVVVLQEETAGRTRRFAILTERLSAPTRFVSLPSRFTVDALSHDGRRLFLTETGTGRSPRSYAVRRFNLMTNRLVPRPVVLKGPPEEMAGEPIARVDHPTESWSYTLYAGGDEPFVHALNTSANSFSLCLDLPWRGLTVEQARPMRLRLDGANLRVVAAGRTLAVMNRRSGAVRVLARPAT